MFRYKPTKSTLIIAAMVILLCLVSITGATYALFTASTGDGTIGTNATSGDLEVDIVDASDNPSSLVGDVLRFVTTSNKQEILFEPGSVYYTEGFRVTNTGNIPMNFFMYISEDRQEGDGFTEAFEVFLTKDPSGRSDMIKIKDFTQYLEAGQSSDVYHLVFRMKTTAGNTFQNKTFTGVGITVYAVQGNGSLG